MIGDIVHRFAPAAVGDAPDLKRLAAHYTVEAYVLHMQAFVGRLGQPRPQEGTPEHLARQMEILAACNTWTAAAALNALLWPGDYNAAEAIQDSHDGKGEASADLLDEWMDRHGIDREAVIQAVYAARAGQVTAMTADLDTVPVHVGDDSLSLMCPTCGSYTPERDSGVKLGLLVRDIVGHTCPEAGAR